MYNIRTICYTHWKSFILNYNIWTPFLVLDEHFKNIWWCLYIYWTFYIMWYFSKIHTEYYSINTHWILLYNIQWTIFLYTLNFFNIQYLKASHFFGSVITSHDTQQGRCATWAILYIACGHMENSIASSECKLAGPIVLGSFFSYFFFPLFTFWKYYKFQEIIYWKHPSHI